MTIKNIISGFLKEVFVRGIKKSDPSQILPGMCLFSTADVQKRGEAAVRGLFSPLRVATPGIYNTGVCAQ